MKVIRTVSVPLFLLIKLFTALGILLLVNFIFALVRIGNWYKFVECQRPQRHVYFQLLVR